MPNKIKILSDKEIEIKLKTLPGWVRKDNKITKEFELENFLNVVHFINDLAPFFEENDHHPDMHISYKKIQFELTRYDIGGKITDKDFLIATEIEQQYKRMHGLTKDNHASRE